MNIRRWIIGMAAIVGLGLGAPSFALGDAEELEELLDQGRQSYIEGDLTKAAVFTREALLMAEETFGPNHQKVAETANNLAYLYLLDGNLADAGPLARRALALREQALEEDDVNIAASLNILAQVYRMQGETDLAAPLYERSLRILEIHEDSQKITRLHHNLGELYLSDGEYIKAEEYLRKALQGRSDLFGRNNSSVAEIMTSLAKLHQAQSNFDEAQELLEKALEIIQLVRGREHRDVVFATYYLADHHRLSGDLEQSESLHSSALAIATDVFVDGHPAFATIYNGIGMVKEEQDGFDEAREYYRRALAIYEESLGPESQYAEFVRNRLENLPIDTDANPSPPTGDVPTLGDQN